MEITKMLTLSTGHITENTSILLDAEAVYSGDLPGLSVYNKDEWGWFIYINAEDYQSERESVPDDLCRCIDLAIENECGLLCLDQDGDRSDLLPWFWD